VAMLARQVWVYRALNGLYVQLDWHHMKILS
jgi:hypothetical protein